MKLFIIGLPGVGKSHFAEQLAALYQIDWIDLDDEIEERQATRISNIFAEKGETHFRELESSVLREMTKAKDDFIMSTGGGTPCFHSNMDYMLDEGICILLKQPIEKIVDQISEDAEVRPMFLGLSQAEIGKKLLDLWRIRKQNYQQTHIITGVQAIQKPQLLTNRVELFTKKGNSLNDIIEID